MSEIPYVQHPEFFSFISDMSKTCMKESCVLYPDGGCRLSSISFVDPLLEVEGDHFSIVGKLRVDCDEPTCEPQIDNSESIIQALDKAIGWARVTLGENKN